MDERRHEGRKRIHLAAGVTVQGMELQAETLDVSSQGVSVRMFRNLPVGATCQLEIRWTGGGHTEFIQAQGRVVHSILSSEGGFRVGMQFVQIDESSRALLSILVQ